MSEKRPSTSNTSKARSAITKAATGERSIHPALIPGVSVEDTNADFRTNKPVFAITLIAVIAVVAWAIIAPESLAGTGMDLRTWVVNNFGWMFTGLMVAILVFLIVIACAPTGRIRLGADDSEPEFSTYSWISMLFAAGLGIALIFYGPFEPLAHFFSPPPNVDVEGGTQEAVMPAMTQSLLHQATMPWVVYCMVGAALAYASFRRGRVPLISALFEPIFPGSSNRVSGRIIDVFAVLVTLFGIGTSLGIGALQLRTGLSIVTGKPLEGDGTMVVLITVLTAIFIMSAMSGVKKGIRILSNINMGLVVALALFVFATGPTLYLLDLMPTTFLNFFDRFVEMMTMAPSQGPVEQEYVNSWTILYWAWWVSWSPFVGMFIAKISKGRTLRQYVTVVLLVPSALSCGWFLIFGGTVIWQNLNGQEVPVEGDGENVMFDLLGHLPLTGLTSGVVILAILVFFNTAADSATNVMGSMSQNGRPIPSKPVIVVWGVALGAVSLFLLLAGGQDALSGLQSIMVACSLPFAFVLMGVMYAFAKDLMSDPLMIRRSYAEAAIDQGVRRGIDQHGDDFIFGAEQVPESHGAGADFESDDPALSEWFTDNATEEYIEEVTSTQAAQREEHERFAEAQENPEQDNPDRPV